MTTSTSTALIATQQASLAKAGKINSCCETYKTDVVRVKRFSDYTTLLAALVPKIEIAERDKNTSRDTTGFTEEKNQRLNVLIVKTDGLGAALRSGNDFKDSESDAQLQKMFKSKLKKISQEVAVDNMASFFIFLAKASPEILAEYAITKDELMEMQTECVAIRDLLKKKEMADKQKMDDQTHLVALFEELDKTMTNMINLSSRFIDIAPDFYAAFNKIVTFRTKAALLKLERAKAARLKNKKKPPTDSNSDKTEPKKPV